MRCRGWFPPNSTAWWSLIAVKEKKKQGGGRGPVVGGEDHLPADSKVQFDNQIKFVYIYGK